METAVLIIGWWLFGFIPTIAVVAYHNEGVTVRDCAWGAFFSLAGPVWILVVIALVAQGFIERAVKRGVLDRVIWQRSSKPSKNDRG